jgi:hypothetical protein
MERAMQKKLNGILLSVPFLIAGASFAAGAQPSSTEAAGVATPAPERVAMPAGCSGCTGADCANCPLMHAATEQSATQPGQAEIHCGVN